MRMDVKDFVVVPVLCPMHQTDCSGCQHAGKFRIKNPPASGTGRADYGAHECSYLDWFEEEYKKKLSEC